MKLVDFSTTFVFSYFVLLCRIGSSLMVIPGVGESYVNLRVKIVFALALTLLVHNVAHVSLPLPQSAIEILLVVVSEICIGVSFGLVGKILLSALYIAGHSISSNIGLSSAMLFDHSQGDQGAVLGGFLSITGLILVINLNLHLYIIDSLIKSYDTLPIGMFFKEYETFTAVITKAFIAAYSVGIRFSAPFMIMSLIVYFGGGVLTRLMPQLQVFFLLLPLQILFGLFVFFTIISVGMIWFIDEYKTLLANLIDF